MKVKEIMHETTMVKCPMSVLDVAKLMSEKNIGSILTGKDGCTMVVTERDIIQKVVALGKDPKKTTVADIMSRCAHTIDSNSDVVEASDMFNEYPIRRLPVTEKEKIIGMVTARDVAKSLAYISARKIQKYGRRVFGKQ